MKAEIKEVNDANGNVMLAVVWIIAPDLNENTMNAARQKLAEVLDRYIGNNCHNRYMHTEKDTVSAVVTFNLENANGYTIEA